MYLAKKALLRPLNSRHQRPEIAELELRIIKKLNQLDIGIMGLGGLSTCLDARIEYSMRHPASYPVGLIVQCYCHRSYSMQIDHNGNVKYGQLDDQYQFQEEVEHF
jgi:fumarate hydratase subunit alpha